MENKLFEVPATPLERVFTFQAYHGNRVAVKLLRLLKEGKIYGVKNLKSQDDYTIFEISIKSVEDKESSFNLLVNEILSYIPDNFPRNYLFSVGNFKMGFVYSFYLRDEDTTNIMHFSHKIKEINKNSIIPNQQIFR